MRKTQARTAAENHHLGGGGHNVGKVGFLPRTHGSALFTRGETQAIVTTTLGTADAEQMLEEVWRVLAPGAPHAPSVGLHGAEWPDRAYCCDFFFVTADLAPRVRALLVLAETAASDHQPVVLELDD